MNKAQECQQILAHFAYDFGLVHETENRVGEKRKRASMQEVQAYITKLHKIAKKLTKMTGIEDIDALEGNLDQLLHKNGIPTVVAVPASATQHMVSTAQAPIGNHAHFSQSPEKFRFAFPVHISLKHAEEFTASDGTSLCIVGFMKQRPTYSVLAALKHEFEMTSSPIPRTAFRMYSSKFVLKQMQRDTGALNQANIIKYGPSVNIYDANATYHMESNGSIINVRVNDVAAKGKRRIKLIDVDSGKIWCVNASFFASLKRTS